jgi:tRNA dimethylallyltransferase
VLLMGPTASGKSALAHTLALRFGGEIVSADSAQVYRGMDIGTAKPGLAERAAVPCHLLDIIDPTEAYSAARFRADAAAAIAAIRSRGRLPIVAGGTMLYFRALTEGLSMLPAADPELRAAIEARAAERGWAALHAELMEVDPATASRLDASDAQRIQRALEVHALSGRPLSALQGRREPAPGLGPTVSLALVPFDRAKLHRAIAARFDAMLGAGLVDEVRGLLARWPLDASMPSMRCVGYRQVLEWLGRGGSVDSLRERGVAATRQLARRQLTWLRRLAVEPLDCFDRGLAGAAGAAVARVLDRSGSPI